MAPSSEDAKTDPELDPKSDAEPEPEPSRELRSWRCLVLYLCLYGFMAQMRPGESFITPYLLGPDKNFTRAQARTSGWALCPGSGLVGPRWRWGGVDWGRLPTPTPQAHCPAVPVTVLGQPWRPAGTWQLSASAGY